MQESKGQGNSVGSLQFKEEAVRLVTEGGRTVSDVADGLGIHENLSADRQEGRVIVMTT